MVRSNCIFAGIEAPVLFDACSYPWWLGGHSVSYIVLPVSSGQSASLNAIAMVLVVDHLTVQSQAQTYAQEPTMLQSFSIHGREACVD
jgi:hypothetical protein